MNDILQKMRPEILRALDSHKYERTSRGIYMPAANVHFGGVFRTWVNDRDEQIDPNVVMLAGLSAMLRAFFAQAAQYTAFYIVPFSNNATPTDDMDASTIQTLGEFTHYTEAQRQLWAKDAEANQTIANAAAPATFTADATAGTVWGAWITTASTKSSTSTQLPAAASKFGGARVLQQNDKLSIEYAFTAADGGA